MVNYCLNRVNFKRSNTYYYIFNWTITNKLQINFNLFFIISYYRIYHCTNRKKLEKNAALNQEKISELISIIDQNISGIKIIKAFNKEDFILNIFKSENEKQNIANKVLWKKDLSSPMSEGLSTITMVIIIWIGGFMVLNNTQAESFIGFTIMFSQIIPLTKSLTSSYYSIKKGSAALNRINEFILIKNEKENLIQNDTQTFNDEILF